MDTDADRQRIERLEIEANQRIAEWSEWRGRMSTQVEALPDRLDEATKGIHARLEDFDRNWNRRMDEQQDVARETLAQTKETNGRVNGHDVQITEIHTVIEQTAHAQQRAEERHRFTLAQLIASGAAVATTAAAIATAAEALHLFS